MAKTGIRYIKGALWFALVIYQVAGKTCDKSDLVNLQCSDSQVCDAKTNVCRCRPGFTFVNDTHCVNGTARSNRTPSQSSLVGGPSNGSILAGIFIPLFLILIIVVGVYTARKYKFYSWVRKKISQRNGNYDEFMIGQDLEDDDPPLR